MKLIVESQENSKFRVEVDVYALSFDPKAKVFTMPLCVGDDWNQTIRCPLDCTPTILHFQWNSLHVWFEFEQDAAAFGEWLVEAESKAQHGYRTMRG